MQKKVKLSLRLVGRKRGIKLQEVVREEGEEQQTKKVRLVKWPGACAEVLLKLRRVCTCFKNLRNVIESGIAASKAFLNAIHAKKCIFSLHMRKEIYRLTSRNQHVFFDLFFFSFFLRRKFGRCAVGVGVVGAVSDNGKCSRSLSILLLH